jgi:hypothetical protein
MGEIPQAEEGMLTLPVGATTQNNVQLTDAQLASYLAA